MECATPSQRNTSAQPVHFHSAYNTTLVRECEQILTHLAAQLHASKSISPHMPLLQLRNHQPYSSSLRYRNLLRLRPSLATSRRKPTSLPSPRTLNSKTCSSHILPCCLRCSVFMLLRSSLTRTINGVTGAGEALEGEEHGEGAGGGVDDKTMHRPGGRRSRAMLML